MTEKASCAECPSVFDLVPPADKAYSVPKEKPTSDDYIKRVYECEDEGHRNTIYWQKKSGAVIGPISAGIDIEEGLSSKYTDPF